VRAAGPLPAAEAPPSWGDVGLTWAVFVAATLAVAGATALIAPDWLDGPTRELPDHATLILDIFVHNLLLSTLPLLGGWLAASHRRAGRPALGALFVVVPALVVARSLFTIGAVGGSDPAWLADASRWWALELMALAAASATGVWLARHPELCERHGLPAMRRALFVIVGALAAGSAVEVLTA
jgi:hypothetical protein